MGAPLDHEFFRSAGHPGFKDAERLLAGLPCSPRVWADLDCLW